MASEELDPQPHKILTIRRILEGVRAKNLQATLIFVDFNKAFDSRKGQPRPTP